MSKSIYEEAIEIIDNNTFELGKGLDVLKPTYRLAVVKALEQAQQQEKLLEQIKDIINRPNDSYIVSMLEVSERYAEIVKLIKELENE